MIRRLFRRPYDGLQHFAPVQEGMLYRCGQPLPDELAQLIARHGLKTVIALRGSRRAEDPDEWEAAERAVCQAHGVEFVTIPCNHKNPPTVAQVEEFLELMRDARRLPAIIHCRIGQQRTGLFCALFRVHVQAMAPADALREMDELGFNIRHSRHRRLLEVFHRHTKEAAPAAAD